MKMKNTWRLFLAAVVLALMLNSCGKKDDAIPAPANQNLAINTFIHSVLRDNRWYLWYDQAPEVAPDDRNPSDYLDALKYVTLDKWSFIIDSTTYNSLSQGVFFGYGLNFRWHIDNSLRISLVSNNSPADMAGLKRGNEIMQINGLRVNYIQNNNLWGSIFGANQPGVSTTFTFKDNLGNVVTKTIQKAQFTQNTVYNEKVFQNVSGANVGYLYFNSFMTGSGVTELETAFQDFHNKGVTRLVIDLRYNGGGQLNTALEFGGLIKGAEDATKPFVSLIFNNYHSDQNETGQLQSYPQSLTGVDKVVFITTPATASASEVLINCLRPYVPDIKVVGDVTDGKPVGMNVQKDPISGMYLFAITFKDVNSLGYGDFYSGIKPDSFCFDGLDHDFGDPDENCLKQALYYLKNGAFDSQILSKKDIILPSQHEFTGVQRFYGIY